MQPQEANTAEVAKVTRIEPFRIRGRFFTAMSLRPDSAPDADFYVALDERLHKVPNFFANAPFVLDLEQASCISDGELAELHSELRRRGLTLFGVQNATEDQETAARKLGLCPLPAGRDTPTERPAASIPVTPQSPTTRMITEPVRSGQTILAERGDLVVIASVGSGAELVAAGNIHVYGQLRGRALAGMHGDRSARVFCQNLDAELLAVAGLYLTSDDFTPALRRRPVQAFLRDEMLCVEELQ